MYYETMMHKRRPVASAEQAAALLHHHKDEQDYLHDYDAIVWTAPDGRELCAVADNHCNNAWFEAAIIDLTNSVQIESLTIGWMETLEKKVEYLKTCETTEHRMGGPCPLPLDGEGGDTKAWFECGCCGDGFESTYKEQKKYDQDNGYGFCPSCARRHY